MEAPRTKRFWIVAGVSLAIVLSFVLNDSFRKAVSRRIEVRRHEAELAALTDEANVVRRKIADLQRPTAYEELVRRDLGYLRPGEKEVRFVKKDLL